MELDKRVQWQTITGQPKTVGDVTVTPQTQALTMRWPFGGFVWNRPVAVLVERDGDTQRFPITDVTLFARLGLFGLGIVFVMMTVLLTVERRRNSDE